VTEPVKQAVISNPIQVLDTLDADVVIEAMKSSSPRMKLVPFAKVPPIESKRPPGVAGERAEAPVSRKVITIDSLDDEDTASKYHLEFGKRQEHLNI